MWEADVSFLPYVNLKKIMFAIEEERDVCVWVRVDVGCLPLLFSALYIIFPIYLLRQGISLNQELADSAMLTGQ